MNEAIRRLASCFLSIATVPVGFAARRLLRRLRTTDFNQYYDLNVVVDPKSDPSGQNGLLLRDKMRAALSFIAQYQPRTIERLRRDLSVIIISKFRGNEGAEYLAPMKALLIHRDPAWRATPGALASLIVANGVIARFALAGLPVRRFPGRIGRRAVLEALNFVEKLPDDQAIAGEWRERLQAFNDYNAQQERTPKTRLELHSAAVTSPANGHHSEIIAMASRRQLTGSEATILAMVQQTFGTNNVPEGVTFTENGEAILFVEAADGSMPLMVHLTNLGRWYEDGTISEQELREQWLKPSEG